MKALWTVFPFVFFVTASAATDYSKGVANLAKTACANGINRKKINESQLIAVLTPVAIDMCNGVNMSTIFQKVMKNVPSVFGLTPSVTMLNDYNTFCNCEKNNAKTDAMTYAMKLFKAITTKAALAKKLFNSSLKDYNAAIKKKEKCETIVPKIAFNINKFLKSKKPKKVIQQGINAANKASTKLEWDCGVKFAAPYADISLYKVTKL